MHTGDSNALMTVDPLLRPSRLAAGALALLLAGACGDDAQGPLDGHSAEPLSTLIVSNSVASASVAGAVISLGGSSVEGVVFISLPPGSVLNGATVVVTTRRTAAQATAAIVDGGFDPIAVAASSGDTLDIRIEIAGGALPFGFIWVVPPSSPPMIVRTDPPPRKRDVPLNAFMRIVFSEPIDAATLTSASVQLLLDGRPVDGELEFGDGMNLTATFTPAQLLDPGAEYSLLITKGIEDLDGDALAQEFRADFRTASPTVVGSVAGLSVVSGNDQPGKAGHELPEPLVVRLADAAGVAWSDVEVKWTVTSGEGVLDGQWVPCPATPWSGFPSAELLWKPVATTSVRTDNQGLAKVSFMPTWFGPVTIRASVPWGVVTFATDASDPNASLELVPGYGDAYTWAWADGSRYFQPPLVVTVRDGQGNAVPYVSVHWRTEPEGLLNGCPDWWVGPSGITRTQADGIVQSRAGFVLSSTRFGAGALGLNTVTATVPGVRGSPLTITRNVTLALIYLSDSKFTGPEGHTDVVHVPVGTRVEFPVNNSTARIVSTSSPPGGASFDSGPLTKDDPFLWYFDAPEAQRFGFVPNVAGTWTFVDQVSGATGTLIATAR